MCTRRGLLESSRTPVIHFFTSTSVMLEVCEWVITVGSGDSFSYQSISSKSRFLFNRRELKKQIEIANSLTVQSSADLCLLMIRIISGVVWLTLKCFSCVGMFRFV
jgi:hypothetical protein